MKFDRKLFEDTYYKHNDRIRKYFLKNSSRIITLDITNGEGWEKLIDFLGLSSDSKNLGAFPNHDFIKRQSISWLSRERKIPPLKLSQNLIPSTIAIEKRQAVNFSMVHKEIGPILTENMKQLLFHLGVINELLVENELLKDNVGLFHGKIGLSIYFFMLARETNNLDHQSIA